MDAVRSYHPTLSCSCQVFCLLQYRPLQEVADSQVTAVDDLEVLVNIIDLTETLTQNNQFLADYLQGETASEREKPKLQNRPQRASSGTKTLALLVTVVTARALSSGLAQHLTNAFACAYLFYLCNTLLHDVQGHFRPMHGRPVIGRRDGGDSSGADLATAKAVLVIMLFVFLSGLGSSHLGDGGSGSSVWQLLLPILLSCHYATNRGDLIIAQALQEGGLMQRDSPVGEVWPVDGAKSKGVFSLKLLSRSKVSVKQAQSALTGFHTGLGLTQTHAILASIIAVVLLYFFGDRGMYLQVLFLTAILFSAWRCLHNQSSNLGSATCNLAAALTLLNLLTILEDMPFAPRLLAHLISPGTYAWLRTLGALILVLGNSRGAGAVEKTGGRGPAQLLFEAISGVFAGIGRRVEARQR